MMSGKPIALADLERRLAIGDRLLGARQRGHAESRRQRAGGGLVAHLLEQLGPRPDEGDARRAQARAKAAFSERKP